MEYQWTFAIYLIFICKIPPAMKKNLLILAILFAALNNVQGQASEAIMLKNVTLVDGSGRPAQKNINMLIKEGKIVSISKDAAKSDARVIDMTGKTIMPLLTNVHGHLGMSKGTITGPDNFTREQIAKRAQAVSSVWRGNRCFHGHG